MKIVRRIAWVTVGFTYFLIALGGTVRVSDSGLSCPDWPLCHGDIFVALDYHVLLEQFHRYTASIVSILIISLAISSLIWARKERQVLIPALLAPCFLVSSDCAWWPHRVMETTTYNHRGTSWDGAGDFRNGHYNSGNVGGGKTKQRTSS